MEVNEYQEQAESTIQFDKKAEEARSIALLGLSGEVGELSTEYKKKLRDGDSYKVFRQKIVEELGDIIWYVSTLATLEGIELNEVLRYNTKKIKDRWTELFDNSVEERFPDDDFPEQERLPRKFTVEFREIESKEGRKVTSITLDGQCFGDPLTDNAYEVDYYRFHDIFHLAYATILCWSPVVRKALKKKRKTNGLHDEIEDGGRAGVIDEAISILVFEHARNHAFFKDVTAIDYGLLRSIKQLTQHLVDVKHCTPKQWEHAILLGFNIWRQLRENSGGRVKCNMYDKTMNFEPLN